MSAEAPVAPRRRGKAAQINPNRSPLFPGVVIPITSKPRLRVGVFCEVINDSVENNGVRVLITETLNNDYVAVEAQDRPLKPCDGTDHIWRARVKMSCLYRIGSQTPTREFRS